MSANSVSVRDWLSAQRRVVEYCENRMTLHFDLAGALKAGQIELAWESRRDLILTALRAHVTRGGQRLTVSSDRIEASLIALETLRLTDPRSAEGISELLGRALPSSTQVLAREADETLDFLAEHLGEPMSRTDAIRLWTEAVRLMREMASSIGLASSDDWYVNEIDSSKSWHEEINDLLAAESK